MEGSAFLTQKWFPFTRPDCSAFRVRKHFKEMKAFENRILAFFHSLLP